MKDSNRRENINTRPKDFVIENPALIRDQIHDKIKQQILFGNISTGSRVLEGRLAKQINVSRTPVREVLRLLEMEGFVELFPRVGYRVRQITREEVMEINETSAALNPWLQRRLLKVKTRAISAP